MTQAPFQLVPEFRYEPTLTGHEAYRRGLVGCFVDHEDAPYWARQVARYENDRLRREAAYYMAVFAASEIRGSGAGKRQCLWHYYMSLDKAAMTGSQRYGNCTSWSGRCCVGNVLSIDILEKGEAHEYPARPGTAVAYSQRGHRGQGMAISTCGRVYEQAGVQVMSSYCDGKYDFTTQNRDEDWGNAHGGRSLPADLAEAIAPHRIKTVAQVPANADAVKDLLQNYYMIHVGSTKTAASSGDPISRLGTPANHAEALIGYDDTDEIRDRLGLRAGQWVGIWDQSWGNWNRVTNWPEDLWGPKPEGAFVLLGDDCLWKIRQGSVAYSDAVGFPARTLPDWGMIQALGA